MTTNRLQLIALDKEAQRQLARYDYDNALQTAQQMMNLDATYDRAYYNAAIAHLQKGDYEAAKRNVEPYRNIPDFVGIFTHATKQLQIQKRQKEEKERRQDFSSTGFRQDFTNVLSYELICQVFEEALQDGFTEFVRYTRVSRRWRAILMSDDIWKRQKRLFAKKFGWKAEQESMLEAGLFHHELALSVSSTMTANNGLKEIMETGTCELARTVLSGPMDWILKVIDSNATTLRDVAICNKPCGDDTIDLLRSLSKCKKLSRLCLKNVNITQLNPKLSNVTHTQKSRHLSSLLSPLKNLDFLKNLRLTRLELRPIPVQSSLMKNWINVQSLVEILRCCPYLQELLIDPRSYEEGSTLRILQACPPSLVLLSIEHDDYNSSRELPVLQLPTTTTTTKQSLWIVAAPVSPPPSPPVTFSYGKTSNVKGSLRHLTIQIDTSHTLAYDVNAALDQFGQNLETLHLSTCVRQMSIETLTELIEEIVWHCPPSIRTLIWDLPINQQCWQVLASPIMLPHLEHFVFQGWKHPLCRDVSQEELAEFFHKATKQERTTLLRRVELHQCGSAIDTESINAITALSALQSLRITGSLDDEQVSLLKRVQNEHRHLEIVYDKTKQ
ncbi:hypothetical protein BDB00DRAFT_874215 [Zychaea mexicana]|uniref:uncharacterized protein n=1 Tax=Zychaea mexicana TaxID=64656 RepID=UPI0022FEEF61|nr:uncharacterized protein BDB00DRAFT_874215 [Zychaea mexicana]KAI9491478.1 hypothetical protein BDB00DRAFT_874215 [Zychaea mexicana]